MSLNRCKSDKTFDFFSNHTILYLTEKIISTSDNRINMKNIIILTIILCLTGLFASPAKSPYRKKVKRVSSGDVYLRISPERQRGETCNPTSTSMILNYYGINANPRDLQEDSGNTDSYKYSAYIMQQLKKYKMHMIPLPMNSAHSDQIFESVKRAIDCGLPLQWLVDLLKAPDYDISKRQKKQLRKQGPVAGHARIFNGYHINRRTQKIDYFIFTDSWGIKHRKKEIKVTDVSKMTSTFFLIIPESLPDEVISYVLEPMTRKSRRK